QAHDRNVGKERTWMPSTSLTHAARMAEGRPARRSTVRRDGTTASPTSASACHATENAKTDNSRPAKNKSDDAWQRSARHGAAGNAEHARLSRNPLGSNCQSSPCPRGTKRTSGICDNEPGTAHTPPRHRANQEHASARGDD